MEILYDKYSLIILDYKGKEDESEIVLIPAHLPLTNSIPVYKGRIKFERINNRLRPLNYFLFVNQKMTNYSSKDFIKSIKLIKYIIIPKNFSPLFADEIKNMFKDYQINLNKIIEPEICTFCHFNNRYTIMKNNKFQLSDRSVCLKCAKKELIKELSFRGLKDKNRIANYLEKILIKIKNVDKVLNFIFSQNLVFQPELTKYDTIPAETFNTTIKIKDLKIPEILKNNMLNRGIDTLLPAQALAVEEGLLKDQNLLIVSATSSGKTLLGELTGIKKVLEKNEKFLFLVPLVALANQIYNDFKSRYEPLGIKVAIKVGMPRINVGDEELVIIDDDITNADIIIATYEGFDVVLRTDFDLAPKNIGTIVIDEIQMLADEDRGYELEGLLGRLKMVYTNSQLICLSATIGNPDKIASNLGLKLINYMGRPVPLERHLILALSENDKLKSIVNLVKNESRYISNQGFKGQSIVFTNSRRKTEEITDFLKSYNIKAVAYHAGMTYSKRKKIEESYLTGIYEVIVTTFALGAGFDAPSSQVIFESLMMGKNYLSVTMFQQMLGRAGRLGKHERGKIVLLVEMGRKAYGSSTETEDQIAINLLEGQVEPVEVFSDLDKQSEQILALISVYGNIDLNKLDHILKIMISIREKPNSILEFLLRKGYIEKLDDSVRITKLGKNISASFLKIDQANYIIENINKKEFLEIAILLEPFESAYLSKRAIAELNNIFRTYFPTRFFAASLLGAINEKNEKLYNKLPKWLINSFTTWLEEIFNCSCKENPFCDCGKLNLSKKIISFRKKGLSPRNISSQLLEKYDIYAYPGDIFNWLENLIHNLSGVKKIAEFLEKIDVIEMINKTINEIEEPF